LIGSLINENGDSNDHPFLKMCSIDKVLEIYKQNVYDKDD